MEISSMGNKRYRCRCAIAIFIAILTFLCSSLFPTPTPPLTVKDSLLIIYSGGRVFDHAVKGILDEIEDELMVQEMIIDRRFTVQQLAKSVSEKMKFYAPKVVILMDNNAIGAFKYYQDKLPAGAVIIPSISLMGVNVEDTIKELKNAYGISYDIPLYTALVHLRAIKSIRVKKTGIIHRNVLNDFVEKNRLYLKDEGIELCNIRLPNHGIDFKKVLRKKLKELLADEKVDSIWIPNDNVLLDSRIIEDVWIPLLKKYKVPVIVGLEYFVSPKLDFGTFAVLPDHIELGTQAAGIVFELKDNNWKFEVNKTEAPLSVLKIINFKQAAKRFKVTKEDVENIDKVLE
ncbi:MAG: hypothetical protein GY757_24680 [bacterium]|nr:hypothetical protein [bacterium]